MSAWEGIEGRVVGAYRAKGRLAVSSHFDPEIMSGGDTLCQCALGVVYHGETLGYSTPTDELNYVDRLAGVLGVESEEVRRFYSAFDSGIHLHKLEKPQYDEDEYSSESSKAGQRTAQAVIAAGLLA